MILEQVFSERRVQDALEEFVSQIEELEDPVCEAFRFWHNNRPFDLKNLHTVAERLGYEIIFANGLHEKAPGYSRLSDDKAYIVIDGNKSPEIQQYTLSYEIGRCVLQHFRGLRPRRGALHAHVFAVTLMMLTTTRSDIEHYFQHDKTAYAVAWYIAKTVFEATAASRFSEEIVRAIRRAPFRIKNGRRKHAFQAKKRIFDREVSFVQGQLREMWAVCPGLESESTQG